MTTYRGHCDVAELLLNRGSEIQEKDIGGFNALFYAASNGFKDIAELLLARGVDFHEKYYGGHTAKLIATKLCSYR